VEADAVVDWSALHAGGVQVSDSLSELLEQMIVDGEIGEDERLPPERDLAQHLGVSRASLRESLHELELKGLIDRRPGRGTVVVNPGRGPLGENLLGRLEPRQRGLREVMDLRAAIEPPIAARAAERRTARDIDRLRSLLVAMERERSVRQAAELDVLFHQAIARATHNPLLVQLLASASEWIDESRRERVLSRRRRTHSIAAHRELLDRIEDRDPEGAAEAMSRHIAAVNRLLREDEEQDHTSDR
jgi:GntR family transcriptional regulator, transcriptional repressor for pyruvate dehydrogenase complex